MRIIRTAYNACTCLFGYLIIFFPVFAASCIVTVQIGNSWMMLYVCIRELIGITYRPTSGKQSDTCQQALSKAFRNAFTGITILSHPRQVFGCFLQIFYNLVINNVAVCLSNIHIRQIGIRRLFLIRNISPITNQLKIGQCTQC